MSHLSPVEFVDLVDGTLAPARAAHVDGCADCRAQVAALQTMVREAADVTVPDPPPFFWDRLSARVRAAVADTRPAGRWRSLVPLASAAALIVAALGGAWIARNTVRPASLAVTSPSPVLGRARATTDDARARAVTDDAALDAASGDVWDVLTSVASEMQIDDARAAGMTVHPAAIDGAVQKMDQDELSELGRLLQSELKRSGN